MTLNLCRIFVSLFVLTLFTSLASHASIAVGDLPFNDVGKTLARQDIKISDYKGKVVIVSFWASWCSPCMKELPILTGIQKTAGADNLQVISINYKEGNKPFKKLSKLLEDSEIIITNDKYGKIGKEFGVEGIPFMMIIGADGRVKNIHIGYGEGMLPKLVAEINQALLDVQA